MVHKESRAKTHRGGQVLRLEWHASRSTLSGRPAPGRTAPGRTVPTRPTAPSSSGAALLEVVAVRSRNHRAIQQMSRRRRRFLRVLWHNRTKRREFPALDGTQPGGCPHLIIVERHFLAVRRPRRLDRQHVILHIRLPGVDLYVITHIAARVPRRRVIWRVHPLPVHHKLCAAQARQSSKSRRGRGLGSFASCRSHAPCSGMSGQAAGSAPARTHCRPAAHRQLHVSRALGLHTAEPARREGVSAPSSERPEPSC